MTRPLIEELLDGAVHGAHAELAARLHGVLELIELALADEIRGRRRIHEDLKRGYPALLVGALQELLRDDPAQRRREHGAHVRLLVGRKRVHEAIHGLRRAVRVQRAHHEDAHLGRRDGDAHGLMVAQFTDQNHIRILAQSRMQCACEACAVHADLALADEAALPLMHELNRILDREDVSLHAVIDVIDHRGESGRFSGAGLAGDEDESVGRARHLAHGLRQFQLIHRERFGGDDAKHPAHAVQLPHDVDAKATLIGERVGKVRAILRLEAIKRDLRHNLV